MTESLIEAAAWGNGQLDTRQDLPSLVPDLRDVILSLKPHDHLCLLYETHSEWLETVVPFMAAGLERGEKCFYIVDTHMADEVRLHISREVPDLSEREASGQWTVLDETESYTVGGSFDPGRMIDVLIAETEKATAEGYSALRVTGEMSWALRGHVGSDRLLEYEALLNRDVFPKYDCLAICQYDLQRFPADIIKGVIMTHPLIVYEGRIYYNFYYMPPESFLGPEREEREVRLWLDNLRVARQAGERARFLSEVFQQSSRPVLAASADGRAVVCNDAFSELTGFTEDELRRMPAVWELVPAELREQEREVYREVLAERGSRSYETRYVRKDGSQVDVEAALKCLHDPEAGLRHFGLYVNDITKRKQIENDMREALRELGKSNDELQQFAYIASHDLREPLRMVSSYVSLLARRYEGKLDADADDFIGFAVDGAARMQRLIDDLLLYSRVGTQGKSFEPTDCEAVLDETVRLLQAGIDESGAEVTHDPLPTVQADPSQLAQLLQNLMSNALKFRGPDPPRIHVAAIREGDEFVFSVSDNGIGIAPEFSERIFRVFERLHSADEYPGTGIGLALCRKIVERHGGRIWVESEPGQGSVFKFSIPAR